MLSSARGATFGAPLPITVEAIGAALALFGVHPEDRDEWVYWIQELDRVWVRASLDRIRAMREGSKRP